MTAAIIRIPCAHEGFYLARTTLRDPQATREQIEAAIDVLRHSRDWFDIRAVSNARHKLWATPHSEVSIPAFRLLDDDELASIGMAPRAALPSRPVDPVPPYNLPLLFAAVFAVTLAGLALGMALQLIWGAV